MAETQVELPTVEECREFMDAINAGREAYGLERIDKLEFDECEPDTPDACLSAHHLVVPIGARHARSDTFDGVPEPNKLAAALGTDVPRFGEVTIPDSILRVTDVFDDAVGEPDELAALRERLAEAGLVA